MWEEREGGKTKDINNNNMEVETKYMNEGEMVGRGYTGGGGWKGKWERAQSDRQFCRHGSLYRRH